MFCHLLFPQVIGDTRKENVVVEEISNFSDWGEVSTILTLSSLINTKNEHGREIINKRRRINHDHGITYSGDNVDHDPLRLSISLIAIDTSKSNGERHEEIEGIINTCVIIKKLFKSDVDESARLLVGKKQIEKHVLPFLKEEEKKSLECSQGIKVGLVDVETDDEFVLNLKKWKTGSYVFTNNWRKDFVRRRELVENDKICLYFDNQNSRLCFRVLEKVAFTPPAGQTREKQSQTRKRKR